MVTRTTEVFQLQLPVEVQLVPDSPCGQIPYSKARLLPLKLQVQQLLQMLDVVNINISALGLPLQCFGIRGFGDHLKIAILASQHVERVAPWQWLTRVHLHLLR